MVNVLKIAGYPTKCLQAPLEAFPRYVYGSILKNLTRDAFPITQNTAENPKILYLSFLFNFKP